MEKLTGNKIAIVATDGAASPNPGRGAWACIVQVGYEEFVSYGTEYPSTNNRMEMTGALKGIKMAISLGAMDIEIVTDSSYLVNGMSKRLGRVVSCPALYGSYGTPNSDLWTELIEYSLKAQTTWRWVKGHADNKLNNKVDEMCRALLRHEKIKKDTK